MQWLPWDDGAWAALSAAAATRGLGRRPGRISAPVSAWTRELSVMLGLYSLWQLAGGLSIGRATGAVAAGRDVSRAERWLHWPTETGVQHLFLGDHALLHAFNLYYFVLHVVVTGACLVWVFARHRGHYPVVRNTVALATGASLVVALVPVAPPRLVPGLGVVDVGRLVGPSIYPTTARPGLDQLSAMPSVHVAWALIVALTVVYILRSPWRWVAFLYPVFTTAVVVITGNHFFADAAVAALIVTASGWVSLRFSAGRRRPSSLPGHDPRSAPVSPPGSGRGSRVPA